jgi:acyl-CoA thioesterase I
MKKIISLSVAFAVGIVGIWMWSTLHTEEPHNTVMEEAERGATTTFSIIAFGDSLTAGYGLPLSESYPAQLQVLLQGMNFSVTVINAGVSGETTRGNFERAPFIRAQNPHIVLLGIGGNDALRFLPIEETRKNMAKTIEILSAGENPPRVVLLGMQAPQNAGAEYKKEFDALYRELATAYNLALVPFITEDVFLNGAYKLQDGIHLNKAGYRKVIDDNLLDVVIAELKNL